MEQHCPVGWKGAKATPPPWLFPCESWELLGNSFEPVPISPGNDPLAFLPAAALGTASHLCVT